MEQTRLPVERERKAQGRIHAEVMSVFGDKSNQKANGN